MKKRAEHSASVRLLQEVVRTIQVQPSYRAVVHRSLSAERLYSPQAADEVERQVMRRQTARMLFCAAVDKGAVFRTVERRFREVVNLSCDYFPLEVGAYMEFADYC